MFTFVSAGLGKGWRETHPPYLSYYVFGADLGCPGFPSMTWPVEIWDPATQFDLSLITPFHEVVLASIFYYLSAPVSGQVTWKWYKERNNFLLFTLSQAIPWTAPGTYAQGGYIGWVPQEINENGRYRVEIRVSSLPNPVATLYLDVSGIPAVITPPPLVVAFVDGIFSAVWDASDYIYAAWTLVKDWVWPFSALSGPIYTLYVVVYSLLTPIANFGEWVTNVATAVVNILSPRNIIDLLQTWLTYAEDAWNWVANAWDNVRDIFDELWAMWSLAIDNWIAIATQGLPDLLVAWNDFWTITLPELVNSTGLAQWWNERLLDIDQLLTTAFTTRQNLWVGWQELKDTVIEFFTNPLDYLLDKFTDWFLGPEV